MLNLKQAVVMAIVLLSGCTDETTAKIEQAQEWCSKHGDAEPYKFEGVNAVCKDGRLVMQYR
jgi:hypothetical protein